MKAQRNKQTEEEIDAFVVAHADDENAWGQPVHCLLYTSDAADE